MITTVSAASEYYSLADLYTGIGEELHEVNGLGLHNLRLDQRICALACYSSWGGRL